MNKGIDINALLNEQRRGWYGVGLIYQKADFGDLGITYRTDSYEAEVIADSGIDAYNFVLERLKVKNLPDSLYPAPDNCDIEFLGAKTDEGYSVEVWNKWKEEGKI